MQDLDRRLFYWINHDWSHPFLDAWLTWITHLRNSLPAIAALVVWLVWRGGRRGRVCVLALTMAIVVTDTLADDWLKPAIDRDRPCVELDDTVLRVKRRKSPSCPSSHAANVFAAMLVFGLYYRRSWFVSAPLAASVAVSRVYVGVHYPFDVGFGALFGAGVGLSSVGLVRLIGTRVPALSVETSDGSRDEREAASAPRASSGPASETDPGAESSPSAGPSEGAEARRPNESPAISAEREGPPEGPLKGPSGAS